MMTTTATPTFFSTYSNTLRELVNQSKDFILEASMTTPLIKYSGSQKKLTIRGNSTAVNVTELYAPVVQMLKKDALTSKSISVDIHLSKINSITLKELFGLFKYLSLKKSTGGEVEVVWRADSTNPEMIDTGLNFSDLYDLDVRIEN